MKGSLPEAVADDGEDREEQLLRQALELFSQSGFRETSLQEVADRLNITRPLLYYYFESKDDLLWRIVGHLGDELLNRARPIAASRLDPVEKMRRLLEGHADTLLLNVDAFRIYFAERHLLAGAREASRKRTPEQAEFDRARHERMLRGETAYAEIQRTVVSEAQQAGLFKAGDPALLARIVTGMGNSLVHWFDTGRAFSRHQVVQAFVDAAIDSLRIEAGSRTHLELI